MSPASASATQAMTLFHLPREIRDLIWKLVLVKKSFQVEGFCTPHDFWIYRSDSNPRETHSGSTLAILRLSKTINRETTPLIYSRPHIRFTCFDAHRHRAHASTSPECVRPRSLSLVTHITVEDELDRYIGFHFNAYDFLRKRLPALQGVTFSALERRSLRDINVDAVLGMLSPFRNVRAVGVYVPREEDPRYEILSQFQRRVEARRESDR